MTIKTLPVFPLAPDPIRPGVSRDVKAQRMTIDSVGPEHSPQIGLITLGCDKNTVASAKMLAALVGHGPRVSFDLDGSDVWVVQTCVFIEADNPQSIETILDACRVQEEGSVRTLVARCCILHRSQYAPRT